MKMFWGMILEPGKKYEQKAESSIHLTMACLEPSNKTPTPNKPSVTSVLLESDKTEFILCNLDQQRFIQQPLDFVFTEGESISFSVNGESKVHLSGYIMPDSDIEDSEDMFDMGGSDESDSEAELVSEDTQKRRMTKNVKDGNKKVKFGDEPAGKGDKKQEKAKPPVKGAKNEVQAKNAQKAKIVDALAEDDDEDDESMDSEDMNDLLDNFEDDEDDEDEDESESSPEVKKVGKPQGKQNQKPATPGKQGGQPGGKPNQNQNQTPQGGKKPFQQGGGGKPWSGGKGGKGGPNSNNSFKNNQNSGKKGTPQGGKKFGGNSPGGKKPWAQKK